MRNVVLLLSAFVLWVGMVPVSLQSQDGAAPAPVDFARDISPIFEQSCFACHSGSTPRGQLRLDVGTLALQGGISGPLLIPGDSGNSLLMTRLKGEGGQPRMPMGPALPADQIALIGRWIDQGAQWPVSSTAASSRIDTHWAYVRPSRPMLPAVRDTAWAEHPIDRFVLARLEQEGLRPSAEATREELIRRLSLDLTGLPPSAREVEAFVGDRGADAYDRLVERLLASPHYGERWARPWLDIARYADSNGFEKDRPRSIWPYRDWVIAALNRNLPFDQFAIEQIAGDLLPNATVEQRVATGFFRNSMLNEEAGVDPEEANWTAQIDRATTVGTAFMGSTIGCAQCHNHKYDPFTQKHFYQLVAFFNNAEFGRGRGGFSRFNEPQLELPTAEQAARRDAIAAIRREHQERLEDSSAAALARQATWEQGVKDAEKEWTPLQPLRVASTGGSVLVTRDDNSILVSGANPAGDTYTIDAALPVGAITGVRIDALPDPSLPRGGPGRDYYGNFVVRAIDVSAGAATDSLTRREIRRTVAADPAPSDLDAGVRAVKRLWAVDATRDGNRRLPHVAVLLPTQPISGRVIRITIAHPTDFIGQGLGRFRVSVTTAADPLAVTVVPARIRALLDVPRESRTAQEQEQVLDQYRAVAPELDATREQLAQLDAQVRALNIPTTLVMSENRAVERPKTFVRNSGSFMAKGDEVEADVPAFLGPLPAQGPRNRLTLARWLVSRDNPLTARVTVNRIWETYFGRGLVETTEDFGTQGARPSHPELLDWLAVELMERGWDVKALHRLIVTSRAYKQSSAVTPELRKRDPANVLLARGARYRVEAEMVRDIALKVSGLLSAKVGGPSVMPPQPDGIWEISFSTEADQWRTSAGEDRYRRGMYTFIRRTAPYPSLTVFDATSREFCTARRSRTNTPLQALTTLNDPAFFEAARAFANRIVAEGGSDDESRLRYAFRLAVSRTPDQVEFQKLRDALRREREHFRGQPKEAAAVAIRGDADLAAWTMIARALLNLDETITRG